MGIVASLAVCSAALHFQQAARGELFMPTRLHPPQKYVNMNTKSLHAHFSFQLAGPWQHLTDVCETVVARSASKHILY